MKHLFNLTPRELEGNFNPRNFDRILGEPVGVPSWPVEYMQREGWRGVYTTDTTILSRIELLAKAKENYQVGNQIWLKAPMEIGDEMLNAVPPALQRGNSFATGEPWSHCERTGRAVYLCFRNFDWAYPTCEAQYLTLKDFVALLTSR